MKNYLSAEFLSDSEVHITNKVDKITMLNYFSQCWIS